MIKSFIAAVWWDTKVAKSFVLFSFLNSQISILNDISEYKMCKKKHMYWQIHAQRLIKALKKWAELKHVLAGFRKVTFMKTGIIK